MHRFNIGRIRNHDAAPRRFTPNRRFFTLNLRRDGLHEIAALRPMFRE
ncbi:hypothetical protein LG3211_3183 [Lysobacter gummosus]|nr:hypothetical protein LG3211_3183 [Lysobacter gummosus]